MKKFSLLVVLLISIFSFAQQNYTNVVVPKSFSFLDEENKYGVNALAKSFFETEGFTTYYDDDGLPLELARNSCQLLYVNAKEQSKLLTTVVVVQLKDCQNNILVTSEEGKSREKEHKKAYVDAFRKALSSLKGKLNVANHYEMDKRPATFEVIAPEVIEVVDEPIQTEGIDPNQLKAIPTKTGFELKNYTDDVVVSLYRTSQKDIFIAKGGSDTNGIVLKKGNDWYFEYYYEGQFFSEKVNVKF